jgi:uncharacterized protein (TIRG00374 family)
MTHNRKKELFVFSLKVFISALLLYACLLLIDLEMLFETIKMLKISEYMIVFVLFCLSIFLGGARSKVFFRGMGIDISFLYGTKLYYIGYFFNNFIPSGVGGDGVRGWLVHRKSGKLKETFSAIVVERISGFVACLAIALIVLPFVEASALVKLGVVFFNLGVWLIIVVLFLPVLTKIVRKVLTPFPFNLSRRVGDFSEKVQSYRHHPDVLIKGFIWSLVYQTSLAGIVWLSSFYIGAGIGFLEMCIITALVWTIAMIPVTPNAIGLREGSFAYLFTIFGANEAQGLIVSLVFFSVSLLSGLLGGVFLFIENMMGKKGKLGNVLSELEEEKELEEAVLENGE